MRYLLNGVGGLLIVCLAVRMAAWLMADAIGPLALLFGLIVAMNVLFNRRRPW